VCICNFAGMPHENYRLPLPFAGEWSEVVNTDAGTYGGSGVGNLGTVKADDEPYFGQPASATLRLPPLATLWLAPKHPTDAP
jgi:1,4-alpha-glucan branching enzyme